MICKAHNPSRIDKCLRTLIRFLNLHGMKTVACCCGHGRYPLTIIVEDKYKNHWDIMSNTMIPRKKRFYLKDKDGYFYIPEVI